jgi:D-glycero-alpha-D-manno-heptose-7-phosphate kinase
MIVSRTPLRMSFAGGGSDLRDYYAQRTGAVVSTTINKYVHIAVNRRFTKDLRIAYSKIEEAHSVDEVEHHLAREALKITGPWKGIDLSYISDLLASHEGSGLGSSSSITAGTLNALYALKGMHVTPKILAEQACEIEIERLGHPIGKQDQYAVAFGGLNCIEFHNDETVSVKKIILNKSVRNELQNNLLAFHTGVNTRSDVVLTEQKKKTEINIEFIDKMVQLSLDLKDALEHSDITEFGSILHQNWLLKKKLASNMSNNIIDSYYNTAMKSGALGGKILGSGGGGFLLFYCEENKQEQLRQALSNLRELDFKFETDGSKIIYVGEDHYN